MKEKATAPSPVNARTQFETLVRSGALKACERHVAGAFDSEDRVAEGIGMTWAWYQKQVALGCTPDLALVRHCCKCRTVDRSHRLDSGDRSHWPQDVFNVQGTRGVELKRLVLLADDDDDVEPDSNLGLAEPGCADPSEKYNSAIDLEAWLRQLSADERTLLAMKQAGHGLVEIGNRLRLTSSGVWQRSRRLGQELAERAGIGIQRKRSRMPRGLPPAVRDAITTE